MADNCSVRVAVRVRPLVSTEIQQGSQDILEVEDEINQVIIRPSSDKAFTFNYVFGPKAQQEELYDRCVQPLIENLFKGYNVTILAYGQTGSGKTHSMGTAYKGEGDLGVIPRAVNEIFTFVRDHFTTDFRITVSFVELYQEVLYDLLTGKSRDQCTLYIREDPVKGIYIPGLTEIPVESVGDVLDVLAKGSLGRATASTNMNAQSSRSHAVFTLSIFMQNKDNCKDNKMAKLHLVDLAGSERLKKTGAVGNTFKEGININKGLFVLGNVISCLGDEAKAAGFVPYRDSNLTRLLKDSLGGNSITLMIACVSPADYNMEETLSTLRYADKARKIKNKPRVNQDSKTAEINELKKAIQLLKLQLAGDGPSVCPAELELAKKETRDLRLKIQDLTTQLSIALSDNTGFLERLLYLQQVNEKSNKKILDLKEKYDVTLSNLTLVSDHNDPSAIKNHLDQLKNIQEELVQMVDDQIISETQIREHREVDLKSPTETARNSLEMEPEIHEVQETHAAQQVQLNTEIKAISHQLLMKEELAKRLLNNVNIMVDYNAITENKDKIESLEQERNDLLQQLKSYRKEANSSNPKLSEQRRKRVQELEHQIAELRKKLQEQSRLIKLKEKDEKRIEQLNKEILQMKQTRVKLVRNMREESDKFRQWKLQRERELIKLKSEDRKKQNQIVKMKTMHDKQQNVFKRKVEEAAALNRRLKDMLALRKQAQDTRNAGKVEKVGHWLKREFDIYTSIVEAQATLAILLQDRATLQKQLSELKADPETANSKVCEELANDIDLRSVQIQDLQQKILDSDEENKKLNFNNIQTMGEAKFALKTIFELIGDNIKRSVQTTTKLNELQETESEFHKKMEEMKKELAAFKEECFNKECQQQKDNEEKISVLLRQLRGLKTEDGAEDGISEMCKIQLEQQDKVMDELRQEVESLKNKLQTIDELGQSCKTPKIVVSKMAECNGTFVKEEQTPDNTEAVLKRNILKERYDCSFEEDDDTKDPDWRNTPLGKRVVEEKRQRLTRLHKLSNNNTVIDKKLSMKRSSEGGCTCKTLCNYRCGCRKMRRSCSECCKCTSQNCTNRTDGTDNKSFDSSEDEMFKRPRINNIAENQENR